jgi:fumarylacetoacetate (FAA) hydrolase
MRLASLKTGGRDGTLVLVSEQDPQSVVVTPAGFATLREAVEEWPSASVTLRELSERFGNDGAVLRRVAADEFHAPLPRAFQWADASTYHAHMERLRAARGMPLPPDHETDPIVYQSGSDRFLAPLEPIELRDEAWGLDLEATVAVVVDDVPQGVGADDARHHIILVLLANDLTHRHLLGAEYAKGVGFYQAKPLRSFAPFAMTPDALGDAWDGGGLRATVECRVNGELLGSLDAAADRAFDFGEIVAHMARTRSLSAGTVIGSGTVANRDPARGFGCLAEKRAVELSEHGEATTRFLRPGDRVHVEAFGADGRSLFGAIDQLVIG